MSEEFDGVYPLGFAIACEQFFIEVDVSFGVESGGRVFWVPFDCAVDSFVLEVLIDVAPITRDSCVWRPAVYVPTKWVRGVREYVHGWLGDAFQRGPDRAMV